MAKKQSPQMHKNFLVRCYIFKNGLPVVIVGMSLDPVRLLAEIKKARTRQARFRISPEKAYFGIFIPAGGVFKFHGTFNPSKCDKSVLSGMGIVEWPSGLEPESTPMSNLKPTMVSLIYMGGVLNVEFCGHIYNEYHGVESPDYKRYFGSPPIPVSFIESLIQWSAPRK